MWPNPQETVDLITFTGEIGSGKLYFLCSEWRLLGIIKTRKKGYKVMCFDIWKYIHSESLFEVYTLR